MNKLSECTLIYIEEGTKENKSPKIIKHERKIRCWDRGLFSSNYYVARNRDMRMSVSLKIQTRYVDDYQNGQLRYVEYKGIEFAIKSILRDKTGINRYGQERYRILDCQEEKM